MKKGIYINCIVILTFLLAGCGQDSIESPASMLTVSSQIDYVSYDSAARRGVDTLNIELELSEQIVGDQYGDSTDDAADDIGPDVEEEAPNEIYPSLSSLSCNHTIITENGIIRETTPLDSWIGLYSFGEGIPNRRIWGYNMWIYEKDNAYYAEISIDGHMTVKRLLATVRGDVNNVEIVFEGYFSRSDNAYYSVGDTLFNLERKENEILTYWDKLQPNIDDNRESGKVYFEKVSQQEIGCVLFLEHYEFLLGNKKDIKDYGYDKACGYFVAKIAVDPEDLDDYQNGLSGFFGNGENNGWTPSDFPEVNETFEWWDLCETEVISFYFATNPDEVRTSYERPTPSTAWAFLARNEADEVFLYVVYLAHAV